MMMELFRTWTRKVEEINRHFKDWNNRLLLDWDNYVDIMGSIIEAMKKYKQNNKHSAGLQLYT